jgi:hypothetical protein
MLKILSYMPDQTLGRLQSRGEFTRCPNPARRRHPSLIPLHPLADHPELPHPQD